MAREFIDDVAREVYITAHRDFLVSSVPERCQDCILPPAAARSAIERTVELEQNPADLGPSFTKVLSECESGSSVEGNTCSGLVEGVRGRRVCGHPTPRPDVVASKIIELTFSSDNSSQS